MYFYLLAECHSHSLLYAASNLPFAQIRIDGFADIVYREAVHDLCHAGISVHPYFRKMSCRHAWICSGIGGICIVDILSHGLYGITDDLPQGYPHRLIHLLKKFP